VHQVKTHTFGGDTGRFTAELQYNGRELSRKVLSNGASRAEAPGAQEAGLYSWQKRLEHCRSEGASEEVLLAFGSEVVNELGREVDRLVTRHSSAVVALVFLPPSSPSFTCLFADCCT
jgi:hypothetical protein